MTASENKRFTPKHSLTALWQSWRMVDPLNPKLNDTGRVLAMAAREGKDRFAQVARELRPEVPN